MTGDPVTPAPLRTVPFGDRAVLATTPDVAGAHLLARRATAARESAPVAIDDVVVGFASVLVVLADGDPATGHHPGDVDDVDELDELAAWLRRLGGDPAADGAPGVRGPTLHELPVTFDGPDLADVARAVGGRPDDVMALLTARDLEVAFVGFAPGFPYLTGLPAELAAVPRRATPRTSVPAGSVAVAGGFASVYPRATPGGWHLLGRTGVSLFDPRRPPHSLVSPGDRVRFVVDRSPGQAPPVDADRGPLDAGGRPALVVAEPGLCDLIQDHGRPGSAALGVPRAGAADPDALALANLLLGNAPSDAAIESTGSGPRLVVVGDAHVVVVGAGPDAVDVAVDGRPVPHATAVPVRDGQTVTVGRVRHGLRAYLAVAGGLRTPELFGSRSSDLLAGLGPGRLRAGDALARGRPGRVRGTLTLPGPGPGRRGEPVVLRVLPGPHVTAPSGDDTPDRRFADLVAAPWQVGDHVDRVGVRLAPTGGTDLAGGAPVDSTPMVTGAVQLPPDGCPIVLLPDHATVGGYPVVACVVAADLARLGQLAPGDTVTFVPVDPSGARAARDRRRSALAGAVSGWFPTAVGT